MKLRIAKKIARQEFEMFSVFENSSIGCMLRSVPPRHRAGTLDRAMRRIAPLFRGAWIVVVREPGGRRTVGMDKERLVRFCAGFAIVPTTTHQIAGSLGEYLKQNI